MMVQVIKLKTNPHKYSSNSYLILSEWKRISDTNVLVDAGIDEYIINDISTINTGVGKRPVDTVILTHTHFDHAGGLQSLKKAYNPTVVAYQSSEYVDRLCEHGEHIQCGDLLFQIFSCPGHSFDSICLYNEEQQILFTGDTNINIVSTDGTFTESYYKCIEMLSKLKVKVVYPGHGQPIEDDPEGIIKRSLKNIKASKIVSNTY